MGGIFVIGTDTGVGKTSICSGLLKLVHGTRKVCYWKPVQTNTITADDTREVKASTSLSADCFVDPLYRFPEPLNPRMAAQKWGKKIDVDAMVKVFQAKTKEGYFVIVEGAGGLLVPFNDQELQIDLIKKLKIPLLVVTEDRVGAINQTLLTLNACKDHGVVVKGVVITRTRRTFGNAEAISHFGKTEILAEFDPTEDVRSLVAQVGGNQRLREVLDVVSLPN